MEMRDLLNLFEDDAVQGRVSAEDLAPMLPAVDNVGYFTSALTKIENGEENTLSTVEYRQLAMAFVSILKAPDAQKTKIIQKLMPVVGQQPPQQTQQTQQVLK